MVEVTVEVTVKVTVKVKVEVTVEVTVKVTVKVTVQVHLFNHLSLSLNAHLQGQRNRFQDRREILLLKTEQIQLKESVSLQPGGRRGGAVSLCSSRTPNWS